MVFEPQHDKTSKMTCASSKDGSACAFTKSNQSAVHSVGRPHGFLMQTVETLMLRLIWVFVGRPCYFVGFVVLWPIYWAKTRKSACATLLIYCGHRAHNATKPKSYIGLQLKYYMCILYCFFNACWIAKWASSRENLSLWVFDQGRLKPACSASETS